MPFYWHYRETCIARIIPHCTFCMITTLTVILGPKTNHYWEWSFGKNNYEMLQNFAWIGSFLSSSGDVIFQNDHGHWWTSDWRRIWSNRMRLWRLQSQDALPSVTRESQKTSICLPLWNLILLTLHSANEPSEPLTLKDLRQWLFSFNTLFSLAF